MLDALRPFIARLVGTFIAAISGWLVAKGVEIDQETQAQLVNSLTLLLWPLMTVVYAVVHKVVSKWTNPGDAASSHLAVAEKIETQNIKKLS